MFGTCSGFPAPELLETHVALFARAQKPHGACQDAPEEIQVLANVRQLKNARA
jgi:hypothetical protein